MKGKINYRQTARLTWIDLRRISSGIDYRRGGPSFEGTLANAILKYRELPRASQACAHIRLLGRRGQAQDRSLGFEEIEEISRRSDLPAGR